MNIVSTQFSLATGSFEIYLAGCSGSPKCQGCHNPVLWDFTIGSPWHTFVDSIAAKLSDVPLIEHVWILGGEPLDNDHQELLELIAGLNAISSLPKWLFTRYELSEVPEAIRDQFDYIKCGRYEPSLKVEGYSQYGVTLATSNQRIYKKGIDY
jgi:anaerobic ribonucleoside-triphosphate reductase activating protein